jgi:hypothetical protein
MNIETSSIGISKWIGNLHAEVIGSIGSGDSKVIAYRRADGEVALETNGDPVFGQQAEEWISDNL